MLEEFRGYADGADIDLLDVLQFNYFLDFFDSCFIRSHESLLKPGCTCFAVDKTATVSNDVLIGQNYDWCTQTHQAQVIDIQGPDTARMLLWTIPGLLGCAGMNEHGLGIVINKLVPQDTRIGLPYTIILRKALQQKHVGDAITILLNASRASGISYLMTDQSGEIHCVETTAEDLEVMSILDGYFAHTNHYIHPRLLIHDAAITQGREGDTYVRLSRMTKLLKRKFGEITEDYMMECFQDRVGYPAAICQSPGTLASMVMNVTRCEMHVANGDPSETDFVTHKFD